MASKILRHTENKEQLYFQPDVGGNETNFDVHGLANGAGFVSDWADLNAIYNGGTPAANIRVPYLYRWEARTKFKTTAAAVGDQIEIRLVTKDESGYVDGNLTVNAALPAEDKLKNLLLAGHITVDKNDLTEYFVESGVVELWSRYVAAVWFNRSTRSLSDTQGDHRFILRPVSFENQ